MNPNDLSHSFFDEPGLLAVRFRGHAAGKTRVRSAPVATTSSAASWATRRQPDPGGLSWSSALPVVAIGLVAGMLLMPDCSGPSRRHDMVITAPRDKDARGETTWHPRLTSLVDNLGPRRADLQPFVVRTLLDVPRELGTRGDVTGGWLQPGLSDEDRRMHQRGVRLAQGLEQAGGGTAGLAIILDLPGPATVAAGAGLAKVTDPVPTFDNLPHPQGVVPSQDTLATAVAWASTYAHAQMIRSLEAPPCFLLEGNRLAPYTNDSGRFDNRSRARLPSVDAFKRLGVTHILYVRERAGDVAERDDLNELFLALAEAGINVRHTGIDRYDTAESATAGTTPATTTPPSTPTSTSGGTTIYRTGPSYGSGWWWPRPHPDDDYVTRRRPVPPALAGPLDGGMSRHDAVLSRIAAPPPDSGGSSSGGSWGRSSSSSSG